MRKPIYANLTLAKVLASRRTSAIGRSRIYATKDTAITNKKINCHRNKVTFIKTSKKSKTMFKTVFDITKQCSLIKQNIPSFDHSVRWHRKPRWVPMAKSKIYRIPKRPEISEEEYNELKRLNKNHHTRVKSIRLFLHHENIAMQSSLANSSSVESQLEEAAEFKMRMELNDEWNAAVARNREARLAQERKEREKIILNYMATRDTRIEKLKVEVDKIVKKELEASKSFVTKETLEAAIEEAIANPMDYNYSIDLKGNIYHGREANSSLAKKDSA